MLQERVNGGDREAADFIVENGIIKGHHYTYVPDTRGLGYELLAAMKSNRDRIAQYIPETDEMDTYGEFLQRCVRTAIRMRSLGLQKNDMISLCSDNHKNISVPYVAAIILGVKISCLDPRLTVNETAHLLKIVEPKMVFASEKGAQLIEEASKICDFSTELVVFSENTHHKKFDEFLVPSTEEGGFEAVVPKDLSEDVVILFSSGTTGTPKGIRLSHYILMHKALEAFYVMGSKERSGFSNYRHGTVEDHYVYLCYSPFYWISATLIMLLSILSGSPRVISNQYQTGDFLRLVEKYKVTSTILTPGMLLELCKCENSKDYDLYSLKYVITGGSPTSTETLLQIREKLPHTFVSQIYGSTETGCVATFFDHNEASDREFARKKVQSCGRPTQGIWYKVVDPETEEILGPHQKGELRIKSKALTSGYYNHDSQTLFDSEGWLCTGDIVYYDNEYCFFVTDRLKRMIKYKSWQIAPSEIENVICQHPAVKEAVVIGIQHPEYGDVPAAAVVLRGDRESVSEEEIKTFVNDRVSEKYKLRGPVKFIDSIPLTVTGKIKTLLLKSMLSSDNEK